ncbi:MAG: hypothetical protein IK095_10235 [Oscillospiraceae bacterium]|nr:hypothetical protein [Oscillospiraceae bacterium]
MIELLRALRKYFFRHRQDRERPGPAPEAQEPVGHAPAPAPDLTQEEEDRVLARFLAMPISSPDEVFAAFRDLPGAIESHGGEKQGYLYVPGTRPDRVVLAAHADTFFDRAYHGQELSNTAVLEDGVYHGTDPSASIGADDRSGCAILWLLRDMGHSLLILDGEEHGQIGSHYLKEQDPELFREINEHSYIVQFDRRGSSDLRFYSLPVTGAFVSFIREKTGYQDVTGPGRTDIVALCRDVCGVNLSVGYYREHHADEILAVEEWRHTLHIAREMLSGPQERYPLAGSSRSSGSF